MSVGKAEPLADLDRRCDRRRIVWWMGHHSLRKHQLGEPPIVNVHKVRVLRWRFISFTLGRAARAIGSLWTV